MQACSNPAQPVTRSSLAIASLSASQVVRTEIISSWRRSKLCGVAPTDSELPFRPDVTRADRLLRAARPVLDWLAEQPGGVAATVVPADADARVIDRRAESQDLNKALDRVLVAPGFSYAEEHAGTNVIGSVLEAGGPIVVAGSEHFRDNLQDFTCVGARRPRAGLTGQRPLVPLGERAYFVGQPLR